jgi:methionine synthase II (cobalamin-independent)
MLQPYTTTGIGSLPHTDPEEAVNLILPAFDIPFWPQLPKLSFRELMIPQYSEGLPFIRLDETRKSVYIERGGDELERFYESYDDSTKIAVSESFAAGLHAFLRLTKGRRFDFLKGHVTGPLTFTLGLTDRAGRPAYYDEELREVYLMGLKAKTRWQVDALRSRADKLVIFIDEPIASALGGTSYMGVRREEAVRLVSEAAAEIKRCGALSGIHCCGRAEWPLLMESGTDILSFDAYEFGDTLGLYPTELRAYLEAGGTLAWGIVPTTEAVKTATEASIREVFLKRMEALSSRVPETLLKERIILTPSCGTGSLSKEQAARVFQLLAGVKESLA